MSSCNTYWFCLNPGVFIFIGAKNILFYDADLKTKVVVEKTKKVESLVQMLLEINQLYCVEIGIEEMNQQEVLSLIYQLRNHYMADLYPATMNFKPIVIPPIVKCHEDLRGSIAQSNILALLNELTFYVNGTCEQKCKFCTEYRRQFHHCYKNNGELPMETIRGILNQVLHTASSLKINFNGGNIFQYSQIKELLEFLKSTQMKSNIYLYYTNWNECYFNDMLNDNIYLHISVDFPVQLHKLREILKHSKKLNDRLKLRFIVRGEKEIEMLEDVIDEIDTDDYFLIPFYDGANLSFFEKYVYIGDDELREESPTKKELYKRQYFNLNDVGKLIVSSNGEYYSNINFPALGNVREKIETVIKREWEEGKAWKRTRNQKPCTECIYQYICPSPSNSDLILNKIDLCQDEIKYKSSI